MSDNLSLEDIINKKSKMRGRGGSSRRGNFPISQGRGRPAPGSGRVTDARLKIIQKNRNKLTDARDKLAEIAKQSDARLKLDKLRASQSKKMDAPTSGISRKTGRDGRITLVTNKAIKATPARAFPGFLSPRQGLPYVPPLMPPPIQAPEYPEDAMDFSNGLLPNFVDYMESQSLRRTVSNEYAPPIFPPPVGRLSLSSPYTWTKPASSPMRKIEPKRTREYKLISRSPVRKVDQGVFREEWDYAPKSRSDDQEVKYFDPRSLKDVGIKSRLDAGSGKTKTMGILGRSKIGGGSVVATGYRIVVSNLQANVTQEDIKELFEDVGDLLVSRLVRPGTAEVIYKTLKDAMKAVETYHNRQLDGHPMKCLLVNPRPKNNPTGPAVRSLTESKRGSNSSYVQPSLGAVHRALFDD